MMPSRSTALLSSLAMLFGGPIAVPAQTWAVAPRPTTVIGDNPDDPREQFVRVTDVALLPGGAIAVLDAGIPIIRAFGPDGRWQRNLGRTGDGPGEFRDPIAITASGTGLGILDRNGRIEWLTRDGRPAQSARVPLGSLRDGRFNVLPGALLEKGSALITAPERMFGRASGEYRQRMGLLLARDGAITDTLGWFTGDSGRTDERGVPVPRPYLPSTGLLWATGNNHVAVMTADQAELRLFDGSGRQTARLTVPLSSGPVRDADVARLVRDQLRPVSGNDRRVVQEWVQGRPRGNRAPLAARLLLPAGRPGEIWIEAWGRPEDRARWIVMSEAGRQLGEVVMPVGFELMEAGGDFVLGIRRDADDVETVERYRLR